MYCIIGKTEQIQILVPRDSKFRLGDPHLTSDQVCQRLLGSMLQEVHTTGGRRGHSWRLGVVGEGQLHASCSEPIHINSAAAVGRHDLYDGDNEQNNGGKNTGKQCDRIPTTYSGRHKQPHETNSIVRRSNSGRQKIRGWENTCDINTAISGSGSRAPPCPAPHPMHFPSFYPPPGSSNRDYNYRYISVCV